MIEELQLKDFQCHKNLVIPFDPKVTVVTGPSDVGKSAIIRALTWVMQNNPSGDAFIRQGASSAVVILSADEQTVVRTRGKNENSYTLGKDDFKAFGNDVPDEIRRLLKISELNFQSQHDAPFWFSETSGEVSRRLNAIINLGIIDRSLSDAAARIVKARVAVEISGNRIDEVKRTYTSLQHVPLLNQALVTVEQLNDTWGKKKEEGRGLRQRMGELREHSQTLRTCDLQASQGQTLIELGQTVFSAADNRKVLTQQIGILERLQKQIEKKLPSIIDLDRAYDSFFLANRRRVELDSNLTVMRELWKTKKKITEDYSVAQTTFNQRTKDEVCPLCGRKL